MYHVMNRGEQREYIFRADEDRQKLLSTLGEACGQTEWQSHAYCLMRHHFHLIVGTPQPNLVLGINWLLGGLRRALVQRSRKKGETWEWPEILRGLDTLQEVKVTFQGKSFLLRSHVLGQAYRAFMATGVALPPTVRETE